MKANEILLSATDTIRDRGLTYGHPADNLEHTAMLLSAYLQMPIHDYQVAGIMVLVKLARSPSNESVVKTIGVVGSSDVSRSEIPEDVLSQTSVRI